MNGIYDVEADWQCYNAASLSNYHQVFQAGSSAIPVKPDFSEVFLL
jgi:hypothetical protein